MILTNTAAEFNTWAWINYRKLYECCMIYGYQMPDVPKLGHEAVQCADIVELVRNVAILIAKRTNVNWNWQDVKNIYANIIYYGILEFRYKEVKND